MRECRSQIAVLSALHELSEPAQIALAFRQGLASLSQVAVDPASVPFVGADPELLLRSVKVALARGLFDDLSFLSGSAGAAALYALASALPAFAPERRELGRHVLGQLHQGDARSFTTLATALAMGAPRAFAGQGLRARLELALLLPASAGACVDRLAFALLSRRELAARFLLEPAGSDLPARRLSARLLERAACYAALRARQGDDGELSSFEAAPIQALFGQLLGDREPLVFRHVASARGLLSAQLARFGEELERDLMASHSLSRVRRGAISLAAQLVVRPAEALARARELMQGPAPARDPGLAAALIYGLPRALEVEPEVGEELLRLALERGGLLAAEALLDLKRALYDSALCARAAELARRQLQPSMERLAEVEGQLELVALLYRALGDPKRESERAPAPARIAPSDEVARPDAAAAVDAGYAWPELTGLPERVGRALLVYARSGPAAALEPAREALALAARQVDRLSLLSHGEPDSAAALREQFCLLHELDVGLLESSALFHLLSTSGGSGDDGRAVQPLTSLLTRLLSVLMAQEELPHHGSAAVPHLAVRMQRLRTLLHLLDADFKPSDELRASVHAEQLRALRKLCERVSRDESSAMDRIVHASLARAVDALVRGEQLELGDVVLCLASAVPRPEGLLALSEGCLLLGLKRALRALSALSQALDGAGSALSGVASALAEVAHALPADESPRTEALRRALLGLERALEAMLAAHSIRELVRSRRAFSLFEGAVIELAYLTREAQRRLGLAPSGPVIDESPVAALARALESAVSQGEVQDLGASLEWLERELARTLPPPFSRGIARVLSTLREWPLARLELPAPEPLAPASAEACPLPAWMPASRRLGDFLVVRPLGSGLASSVFLVKRSDQRKERAAPWLALKVPRYEARMARALSEAEFEAAFAREAAALLNVPPHPQLASCVSVASRAEPKPFLVMEWVDGPSLARVRKRKLDAVAVLDGILAGLEVLHAVGVGHLDLTPSNVVLRQREGALSPVLVDFGLAGRHIRPGCGQATYAAPELWLGSESTPMAVDVYAVGCLAYELVTGRSLFYAKSELNVAAAHLSHDGMPPRLVELANEPRTAALAHWIALCLRRDPQQRASVTELRRELR